MFLIACIYDRILSCARECAHMRAQFVSLTIVCLFLIGFLCYQKRSCLQTSYFSRFLNRFLAWGLWVFNWIPLLSEKIAPADLIFRKVSKTWFLAWGLCVSNWILMLSDKKIAPEDVMFLKVFKHDFSHAVLWVFNCILCYQRRSRVRTSYFLSARVRAGARNLTQCIAFPLWRCVI